MKTKRFVSSFVLSLIIMQMVSCSSNEDEIRPAVDENTMHTAVLRLDGHVERFNDESTTRAATSEWDDGAKLYIQYETTSGRVDGIATYSLNTDEWEVQYYGTINRGEVSKCEVYYFTNPQSTSMTSVALTEQSAVYADKQASYILEDGVMKLSAHLKPLTGRLRFRGKAGTSVTFSGLKWHTEYNISNNTLSQSTSNLTLTVASDGFTPYVYGLLADYVVQVTIDSGNDNYYFHKTFGSDVLAVGKSGFIDIPTMDSHNGWKLIEDPLGLCPDANHPHKIDMGTDVMFACCNVGAKTPVEYGDYFAWGETKAKSTYNWSTYKWCKGSNSTLTKYCTKSLYGTVDNKTQLELSDDAARANWGGTWRMPTIDELNELNSKCAWIWTTLNGVNGYKVTAPNGNVLFLPAAGYHFDYLQWAGHEGWYWSSSLYLELVYDAMDFKVNSSGWHHWGESSRNSGQSVRPVTK